MISNQMNKNKLIKQKHNINNKKSGTSKESSGIYDSSTSAAAAALKPGQCQNAKSEMVTMPTDGANGAGPSNPVFHPDLGVERVILPPPIIAEIQKSAKSAAVPPVGAGTVGKAPTTSTKKKFSFTERRSTGDILQRHHNNAGSNRSADWLKKRQRSQDVPAPSEKKLRVQPGMTFAQMTNEKILIGVLEQGNLDGRISRSQWKWMETALAIRCFEMMEKKPGPPPIGKDIVSLELHPAPIRLLTCYMPYDQLGPPPEDITRSLIQVCMTHKIGLIIDCDANAHHKPT
ncbi:hypothetical protein ACLKA7_007854 [Drosophila subpalustris]